MPKPGIKYFAGSFLLSLVAVFVAAKAYLLLTLSEQKNEQAVASIKAKNIELFAVNEEEDPLYNKFKEVSQTNDPLMAEPNELEILENSDDVLYGEDAKTADNDVANEKTLNKDEDTEVALLDDELVIEDSAEFVESFEQPAANDADHDLDIADAAQAPTFTIPLKHNYNIEGGTVTVSDGAESGKIALASHDVSIYNLGTQNQADITEPLNENTDTQEENSIEQAKASPARTSVSETDNVSTQTADDDPWEVAETANKHAAKNTLSIKSPTEEADVALPAQEVQTAYKPQQNILIPIPDEIMKEDNLTPQFSSSKENLELERELKAKNNLPQMDKDADPSALTDGISSSGSAKDKSNNEEAQPQKSNAPVGSESDTQIKIRPVPAQIPADDNEKDFDEQNESNADDSASKSLTDSITAWFSGVKTKAVNLTSSATSATKDNHSEDTSVSKKSGGSIFQRLLGPQEEEKAIAPSELKITFQPNKAEISGQTLEWLRAFADNTLHNETVVVEIRASQEAPQDIQQKRLKLLYKLLADKGVDYHKINIIFTNREPNSFIIRNVRYASEEELAKAVVKWGDNPW